jgi:hypothetical protein
MQKTIAKQQNVKQPAEHKQNNKHKQQSANTKAQTT